MRTLLLGTTVLAAAALLGPMLIPAQTQAQEAQYPWAQNPWAQNRAAQYQAPQNQTVQGQNTPTVRLGGYLREYYGYSTQGSTNKPGNPALPQAAGAGPGSGTTTHGGRHDFSTTAQLHLLINGKAANGIRWGTVVEGEFAFNASTSSSGDTDAWANLDQAYAFVTHPRYGQLRVGAEAGPMGGLMNSGYVTNFGSGGIYGDWQNFVTRATRSVVTSPASLGNNTKIAYISPQYKGFDFGASYAFNQGTSAGRGCYNGFVGGSCDTIAATTASGLRTGIDVPGRDNEVQLAARWRGMVGPVGLSATAGFIGGTASRDYAIAAVDSRHLRDPQVYQAGVQGTAYGFTAGFNYEYGNTAAFYIPTAGGAKWHNQYSAGLSYAIGPVSVGANTFWGSYAGADSWNFAAQGSGSTQRRYGYGVGANYRLTRGLDLVAEYVHHVIHEPGTDLDGISRNGTQDSLRTNVLLVGARLAF